MPSPFSIYGVEIELMIVSRETLNALPIAEHLLRDRHGVIVNSLEKGKVTWSNELVSHVLEFKMTEPAPTLDGWDVRVQASVDEANRLLAGENAGLLGGGMHPWFDPATETRLWESDEREIYETFDRIFSCRGHGWSNLQSFHLNLPFATDDDFRRLHSAIRLVLPLVPVLAAASPIAGGKPTGFLDTRLDAYQQNCARIPTVTGGVIPDVMRSETEYRERIFLPIARDLAPHDPERVLDPEWTNARGAIARFDRGAIEIRLGDAQECPRRDLAIIQAIVFLVRGLFEERWSSLTDQEAVTSGELRDWFESSIRIGRQAGIRSERILAGFGFSEPLDSATALRTRIEGARETDWKVEIGDILNRGNLAERLLESAGVATPADLQRTWQALRECLADGQPFVP